LPPCALPRATLACRPRINGEDKRIKYELQSPTCRQRVEIFSAALGRLELVLRHLRAIRQDQAALGITVECQIHLLRHFSVWVSESSLSWMHTTVSCPRATTSPESRAPTLAFLPGSPAAPFERRRTGCRSLAYAGELSTTCYRLGRGAQLGRLQRASRRMPVRMDGAGRWLAARACSHTFEDTSGGERLNPLSDWIRGPSLLYCFSGAK
jgi:hypothetical protein